MKLAEAIKKSSLGTTESNCPEVDSSVPYQSQHTAINTPQNRIKLMTQGVREHSKGQEVDNVLSAPVKYIDYELNKHFEVAYSFSSYTYQPQIKDIDVNADFFNPTADEPMPIEEFLKYLDMSKIEAILRDYYAESYRSKYPMNAMFKSLIYYKLKGFKFLTQMYRMLLSHDTLAEDLGFQWDEKGIPSYKTLYHFMYYRIGEDGLRELFNMLLNDNIDLCKNYGIKVGEEFAIDATPIQGKRADKDATYNGHYKINGYLLHNMRCLKTNLPVWFGLTTSITKEGKFFGVAIREFFITTGQKPKKAYVDCGYSSFENIAKIKGLKNIDIVTNIGKEWVIHKNADEYHIKKLYNNHWEHPDFDPHATMDEILRFFMLNDPVGVKLFGKMYRNEILERYRKDKGAYLKDYHKRSRIECCHGNDKRHSQLNNIEARGIEKIKINIGWYFICLHILANIRLSNGECNGLNNVAGLI